MKYITHCGGGATLLYDTQPGAAQDAPVTTPTDGGTIQIRRG